MANWNNRATKWKDINWGIVSKFFFIFFLVIFVIFIFWSLFMHFDAKKEIRTIEMNNKVYATGVSLSTANYQWHVYYEFIDDDGTKYGTWRGYGHKTAAEFHLGEQIEIYIDGKGHCVQVGMNPKPQLWLMFSIGLLVFTSAYVVLCIYLRRAKRKNPNGTI